MFCSKPVSRHGEHIFPKWAHDYLPTSTSRYKSREIFGVEEKRPARPGSPKNITVRAVCAKCNNGWMSKLEEAAKPTLIKLMLPKGSFLLTYDERQTLATWMSLKVLVVDADTEARPIFTKLDYESFKDEPAPLSRTIFSMFLCSPMARKMPAYKRNYASALTGGGRPDISHVVNFTFSWFPVLLHCWTYRGAPAVFISEGEPSATRIWPTETTVARWPPAYVIGLKDAEAVRNLAHRGQLIALDPEALGGVYPAE